jgi:hypothetical protein
MFSLFSVPLLRSAAAMAAVMAGGAREEATAMLELGERRGALGARLGAAQLQPRQHAAQP